MMFHLIRASLFGVLALGLPTICFAQSGYQSYRPYHNLPNVAAERYPLGVGVQHSRGGCRIPRIGSNGLFRRTNPQLIPIGPGQFPDQPGIPTIPPGQQPFLVPGVSVPPIQPQIPPRGLPFQPTPPGLDVTGLSNQLQGMYSSFLRRNATPQELSYWMSEFVGGRSDLPGARAALLASNEYYNLCHNNPGLWLKSTIEHATNRPATQFELQIWSTKLYHEHFGDRGQCTVALLRALGGL